MLLATDLADFVVVSNGAASGLGGRTPIEYERNLINSGRNAGLKCGALRRTGQGHSFSLEHRVTSFPLRYSVNSGRPSPNTAHTPER